MDDTNRFQDALARIADVANEAIRGGCSNGEDSLAKYAPPEGEAVCAPKMIPDRLQIKAAETAANVNPVNSPMLEAGGAGIMRPLEIAVLTQKYWGWRSRQLTVSFMESAPANLRQRILSHMNSWRTAVSFVETGGVGNIRISRSGRGYWSYVGTDVLLIPRNRPTMNLAGFTMNTPESEYKRVVRHETGHTLGFPHEHMRRELVARIDPEKAYDYFRRTQGWDRAMVDSQVLTPLDQRSIFATAPDQTSIMCYQLPAAITKDGRPILGGDDINRTDALFARRIYPTFGFGLSAGLGTVEDERIEYERAQGESFETTIPGLEDDWSESEDVQGIDFEVGV